MQKPNVAGSFTYGSKRAGLEYCDSKDKGGTLGIPLRLGGRPQLGFTIIEVVLVLAIAGLILAMVFIALPAL